MNYDNVSINVSIFPKEKAVPLVSVVMPVYNGERFLAEAIDSILTQTFSDFEFIIVDDGSTDCSPEIIQAYDERDARVSFVQLAENMGEAGARNAGIAVAKGDFIAAMDCDDISLPERLRMQVDYMEAHPDIGGVGVGAAVVYEDLTPRFTYTLPTCHPLILLSMMVGGSALLYASIMVRREFFAEAGGYDPKFRSAPDFELFLRMVWENGIRYANLPTLLYLYRRHEASISHNRQSWPSPGATLARSRALELLWGEAPKGTVDLFMKVRPGMKLSWQERRLARRDISRLIESMVDANWVGQGERPLMLAEMHRRLEGTTPRFWQMFLHLWRYRIGPFLK